MLDALTVTVASKNLAAFETARNREPKGQAAWYRTVSGGPTGSYLALVPRQTWADLVSRPALLGKAAALVEHVEVEGWSYRPKLSLIP